VLSIGLDLLGQDAEASKKHYSLYTALAAAKIIIDSPKEVQQIWEYSAENPAKGPTMGAIQTAVAIWRTAVALSQIGAGGSKDGGGSYWAGGATGDGARMAVSPMGQLLAMSGMSVGANGWLLDGSGFAVAGIVHEDEYVIPKWQLADPQVAAVAQWLEARRLRGFADERYQRRRGEAASPGGDEKLYPVMTRLLVVNQQQAAQLADVKQWQRDLNVRLDLRTTQGGLDAYKQVQAAARFGVKGRPTIGPQKGSSKRPQKPAFLGPFATTLLLEDRSCYFWDRREVQLITILKRCYVLRKDTHTASNTF